MCAKFKISNCGTIKIHPYVNYLSPTLILACKTKTDECQGYGLKKASDYIIGIFVYSHTTNIIGMLLY